MAKIVNLCQEFYVLNTGHIPESKEKLNRYIIKIKKQVTNDCDLTELLDLIQPNTNTEELFKLEIAIAVGNISFPLTSLKRGNLLLIKRILRYSEFLRYAFRQISAEQLVVEVMPCLSYSTKIKLLNKLAMHLDDEYLLETYYNGLQFEYPDFLIYVLPGCSIEFIKETINQPNYSISERSLYLTIKNKIMLLGDDLKTIEQRYGIFSSFPKAIAHLANNNVDLFWLLEENFRFTVELGALTTKNVLRNNLEKIQLGEDLLNILDWNMFHKVLKKNNMLTEFVGYCFLTERSDVFKENDMLILKFIQATEPKEKVWETIRRGYEEKYSVDFFENLLSFRICEDIIKVILNCESDRDKIWDYISEYCHRLMYLQSPNVIIPILKERLITTDSPSLINKMFENCALHKDNRSFQEVLDFLFHTFRYEIKMFGILFYDFCDWDYFEEFNPNMWAVIDDVFELHNHHQCLVKCHLPFYFNHLVESGKSVEKYFQSLIASLHLTDKMNENPFAGRKYEYIALEAFGNILEELCHGNLYCYMCMKYTQWVLDHNQRCRSNRILLTKYPNIIYFFVSSLFKDATNSLYSCLKQFEFEQFDIAFWKNIRIRIREDILIWYKRYHPERLIQNKEDVFRYNTYKVTIFLKNLYHYPQQNVIDTYKTYARNVLCRIDYDRACFAAIFLSIFAQDEFYNLAETMKPSPDGKIPYGITFDKVTLQRAISEAIKNIDSSKNKLILIKQYCIGYYVKYCCGTFMNVCANTPEFAVLLFLKGINDNTNLKHVKRAKKAFLCKSVAAETIVLEQAETTKIKDVSSLLNNMPAEQVLPYLRREFTDTNCSRFLDQLDDITDEEIKQFDVKVLKFFLEQTLFIKDMGEFYYRCIFVSTGQTKFELLDYCIHLFKKFIETHRSKIGIDPAFHAVITEFIEALCDNSIESQENAEVMVELLLRYPTIIDPEVSISAYLTLEFTVLYFESDFDFEELGRRCNVMVSHYIEKYGGVVIDVFSKVLRRLFRNNNENDKVNLLRGLLEEFNTNAAVLALHILPPYCLNSDSSSSDDDDHEKLNQFYEILKQSKEPVIKFFLHMQRNSYD